MGSKATTTLAIGADENGAEQGASANVPIGHASCYRPEDLNEAAESESYRSTSRARSGRGSSFSLGKAATMPSGPNLNEYVTAEHALKYLSRVDGIPHRAEGDAALLSFIPQSARRILDLGTGDGRLLALLLIERQHAEGIAIDFSPTMLAAARKRFAGKPSVRVVEHNLEVSLPNLGRFDAIVSGFAIHHCHDARKKEIYQEIYSALTPGGVFCNLEHVASATPQLHQRFLDALGVTAADEDPSNKLALVEPQLAWLREIGYEEVDCYWKWMELALFGGIKPKNA